MFTKIKKTKVKVSDYYYKQEEEGFSLLELLITLAIFGILLVTTTSIILINLTAARRIKSRSYTREESAFMLNILKKDIRNANSILCPDGIGGYTSCGTTTVHEMLVNITEDTGPYNYIWKQSGSEIVREDLNAKISFKTPSDVTFDNSQGGLPFTLDTDCDAENCVIRIRFRAWTEGMSDNPRQWIEKEVAVSTRNFEN
ncbi:PilW family protein [Patescibacteria group bacterium]